MVLDKKVVGALALVVSIAVGYAYLRIDSLTKRVDQLSSTTTHLAGSLTDATTTLANALNEERQSVASQLGGVKDQVGSLNGTLTDLQKLSTTDPELLAKYSKVFFLSDTYAPVRLAEIPAPYTYNEKLSMQVIPEVLPRLTQMLDQAKTDGVTLYVDSAYRSFNTQEALKERYKLTYGAGTANSFSADQGYSEHQLGTTIDLITTGTGGRLEGFDKTPAYPWLEANAYRYGFTLSYPKGNGYYVFEPWHWRFVGVKLATNLHAKQQYFYQLDQRTIDQYLISLFDN